MNAPSYGPSQPSHSSPRPATPPPPEHDFRLNPQFAIAAVAVDMMNGGIEFASMGALFAFSLFTAAVLFFAGIIIQHKAGDPLSLAIAKSMLVALVVAIPTPIPGCLIAAWGVGSSMKGQSHLRMTTTRPT